MHVPRAYMPVMLAKGPAPMPFTARSVALATNFSDSSELGSQHYGHFMTSRALHFVKRDVKRDRRCTFAPEQDRHASRWDAAVSDIFMVPLHVSARSCPRIWQSAFGAPSGREGACEASLCSGSLMELE